MNCYDLTLELIRVMAEIDNVIDKKSRVSRIDEKDRLDREIDRLEIRMYEIKNILKNAQA